MQSSLSMSLEQQKIENTTSSSSHEDNEGFVRIDFDEIQFDEIAGSLLNVCYMDVKTSSFFLYSHARALADGAITGPSMTAHGMERPATHCI